MPIEMERVMKEDFMVCNNPSVDNGILSLKILVFRINVMRIRLSGQFEYWLNYEKI